MRGSDSTGLSLERGTIVAVASPSFCGDSALVAELAALGVDVRLNQTGRTLKGDALADFLRGAPVAVIGRERIDDALLAACPGLRLIAKYGVGMDNLDEDALRARGVVAGMTPGVNRLAVAELALGFMITHFRNLAVSDRRLKAGAWVKDGGRQLSELSVGIVGFGNTGQELARLLTAFGSRVFYTDIVDRAGAAGALKAVPKALPELLGACDVVSLHVPLTPLTAGMIGPEALRRMKNDALLINTARGEVLDFSAAAAAVRAGRLGGLACDVYTVEPCDLSAWAGLDRLQLTPHIGGNARAAVLAMGRAAIDWIRRSMKA